MLLFILWHLSVAFKLMGNVLVLLRRRKNRRFEEIWCKNCLAEAVEFTGFSDLQQGPCDSPGSQAKSRMSFYSCLSSRHSPFSNPYCSPENIALFSSSNKKSPNSHLLVIVLGMGGNCLDHKTLSTELPLH